MYREREKVTEEGWPAFYWDPCLLGCSTWSTEPEEPPESLRTEKLAGPQGEVGRPGQALLRVPVKRLRARWHQ